MCLSLLCVCVCVRVSPGYSETGCFGMGADSFWDDRKKIDEARAAPPQDEDDDDDDDGEAAHIESECFRVRC